MEISSIRKKAVRALEESKDLLELTKVHKDLLGKKGEINALLKNLGSISILERKELGKLLNSLKVELQDIYKSKKEIFKDNFSDEKLKGEKIDITLPGRSFSLGTLHPVTSTIFEITKFFTSIGFDIAWGPESETDYYNFESLNIFQDHPAKDMHDTFYL